MLPHASRHRVHGQLIFGWGAFNLVEGIIDHHLLNLRHIRDLPVHVPVYDWIFLGLGGIGLVTLGWLMMGTFHSRVAD